MSNSVPSHSDPACADPNCSYRAEAEMAIETRENANTVSLRVEDENRRLREALTTAQGEAYLGALEGDDTPDPLAACHNVIKACQEALSA